MSDDVCTVTFVAGGDISIEITARFNLIVAQCTGPTRFKYPTGGGVDGDFAAGWASEKFFDTTPGMTATSTSMPSAMEGDPAPSRSTKHTYDPGGGIIIAHMNSATFDPAGQAENFVTFQFSARKIPWITGNTADMVFRALIKQDDRFFEGPGFEVQAVDFLWLPLTTGACLTQNSFQEQGTMANPDFGRPMQFGYATANSGAGAPVVDREGLLDNFRVEVR